MLVVKMYEKYRMKASSPSCEIAITILIVALLLIVIVVFCVVCNKQITKSSVETLTPPTASDILYAKSLERAIRNFEKIAHNGKTDLLSRNGGAAFIVHDCAHHRHLNYGHATTEKVEQSAVPQPKDRPRY